MSETVARAAVITVARGRHEHLARQQAMLSALRWDVARVVVSMDDPSLAAVTRQHPGVQTITVPVADPGRLPLAAARNAGAEAALEAGAELLVFLDVDCLPGDRLLERTLRCRPPGTTPCLCGPVTYLPQGAVLGGCPSGASSMRCASPHAARPDPAGGDVVAGDDVDLFWSLSFAVTACTWRTVGGFRTGYAGYGGEDTDFAGRPGGPAASCSGSAAPTPTTSTTRCRGPRSSTSTPSSERRRVPPAVGRVADARLARRVRRPGPGPRHGRGLGTHRVEGAVHEGVLRWPSARNTGGPSRSSPRRDAP